MNTPPPTGQSGRGRGRGYASRSNKKGGNPNPKARPPPKAHQTPVQGQTKSPFSGPRSPTPPAASPELQTGVSSVASLPAVTTAFAPLLTQPNVTMTQDPHVPSVALRAPTPLSALNASRGGSSSSSSNRPSSFMSLLKPTATYAQMPAVQTVSPSIPEMYKAPSSLSSSSEKPKAVPPEPVGNVISRCTDYSHYYDWICKNFPDLANHPTKWFINFLLKFNSFDHMYMYSEFTPDQWLELLGGRNYHKFYHLIAELKVIWSIMLYTVDPVPVIEYVGAREVMLSVYYEPLAALADQVPKAPKISAPKYTKVSSSVPALRTGLRPNTVQSRPMSPKAYASTPQSYHSTKPGMMDSVGRFPTIEDAKSERDEAYEEGWDECEAVGLGGPTRAEIMQEDAEFAALDAAIALEEGQLQETVDTLNSWKPSAVTDKASVVEDRS